MKNFKLFVAYGVIQNSKHIYYNTECNITDLASLLDAVQYDHVIGLFKDNRRNDNNFIEADCVIMDCDNEKSDTQDDWLTPERLHEQLPDVPFYAVYSRNNMKQKGDKSPRPRFHMYFPLSETFTKAKEIRELQTKLLGLIPDTDKGAAKVSQPYYGVNSPNGIAFDGDIYIDEFVLINGIEAPTERAVDDDGEAAPDTEGTYHEGERNTTMFSIAQKVLMKYKKVQDARNAFDKACLRCSPPLPHSEVMSIWHSALKIHKSYEDKFSQPRKILTAPEIERALHSYNISVRLNLITRAVEVSDLPADNPYVMDIHKNAATGIREQLNLRQLPLFLAIHFKSNGFSFSDTFIDGILNDIAYANSYNPFLDMIESTIWDGQDRLSELGRVLGIQHNEYHCKFLRKWLHQVISLAGNTDSELCQSFVLVLQGKQGCGKTSFFRKLAIYPEWFNEGISIDMRDKDSRIQASTGLIGELGELDSTLKREQSQLKSFLDNRCDYYRLPYARQSQKYPRCTTFCGTVNPEQFHRDDTGSRRFIYIHVDNMNNDFIQSRMDKDWVMQLWRQVYEQVYKVNGKKGYYLTPQEQAIAAAGNEDFREPSNAEATLLDVLDFENDDALWTEYTATDIRNKFKELEKYEPKAIGQALTALQARYPRINRRKIDGKARYSIPQRSY